MADKKKNIQKSNKGIFRVFELAAEIIGWLQIAVSPFLIGLAIGAIVYFQNPSPKRLVFGISGATLGLIVGIIWATKIWKRKGTILFLSRIMATPDLDSPNENDKTKVKDIQKDDK